MTMRKILCAFCLAACAAVASAQPAVRSSLGKEFYCMVMKNSGSSLDGNPEDDCNQSPQYFRVFLSSSFAATATLAITDRSWDTTVEIAPNAVTTVTLPASVEDTSFEIATQQAVHITADTLISVFLIYHKVFSSDSYLALPVSALGNDYV